MSPIFEMLPIILNSNTTQKCRRRRWKIMKDSFGWDVCWSLLETLQKLSLIQCVCFLFALLLMLISRDCKDSPYFCSEILQIYFSGKLQSFDHHSVDTKKELWDMDTSDGTGLIRIVAAKECNSQVQVGTWGANVYHGSKKTSLYLIDVTAKAKKFCCRNSRVLAQQALGVAPELLQDSNSADSVHSASAGKLKVLHDVLHAVQLYNMTWRTTHTGTWRITRLKRSFCRRTLTL